MDNLDQVVSEVKAAFASISDPDALEQVKARFLGKSGPDYYEVSSRA